MYAGISRFYIWIRGLSEFVVKLKIGGDSNLGLGVALSQHWVKDSPIAGLGEGWGWVAVPLFLNLGL